MLFAPPKTSLFLFTFAAFGLVITSQAARGNLAKLAPPEPALALLGTGFIGLALLRNKRRRGMVLATLAGMLAVDAHAQDPDYTNVGDILNGKRHLLEIDDLVISGSVGSPTSFGAEGTDLAMAALGTSNSFPSSNPIATNTWGNAALDYQLTKTYTARMWNLPYAATIVLGTQAINQEPCTLSLPNLPSYVGPVPPIAAYFFPFFGDAPTYPDATGLAVGDFNGDAYDDLVLNFGERCTAKHRTWR